MKKRNICIVSFCNLYLLPYAKIYINSILDSGSNCTLIIWDREMSGGKKDREAFPSCTHIVFEKYKPIGYGGRGYLINTYYSAIKFIRKELKKNQYDGIIFLHTHAAVATLDILHRRYKGKYIVDIRDYTLENHTLFKMLEKRTLKESYRIVISSPEYRIFLPEADYVVAHNYSELIGERATAIKERLDTKQPPLSISFIGTVRFYDMDKKILDLFANDDRFKICYYGSGSDTLRLYAEKKNINNVDFCGSFSPDQTLDFYMGTAMINNLYGNHSPYLDYALSNKLYYATQLYIPILVCPETYMEKIVLKYNIGFVVDVTNNNTPDIIWKQYKNLNRESFIKGCDSFIRNVKDDNERFMEMCVLFARGL